ncbi:hypothetical protein Tco_0800587 [Tanacetum coccineum]|uniref:Uncharacterized protein n=1 Tax=Tanacetum coccineum TaxID=301880 RepID=A0ABQ4ZTJ9_9ASTR
MGACSSCKRSKPEVAFTTIRIVHLDGYLENYEDPATVDQVINNFPKHFLCTPLQVLQNGLVPLSHDHQLKTGQIYFILPNSTLRFNDSPQDLTSLTRKLTKIAKTGQCPFKTTKRSPSSASSLPTPQATSPRPCLDSRFGNNGEDIMLNSPKSPQWIPVLDTIIEG